MAEPIIHELKTLPIYFKPLISGKKTFEVRVYQDKFKIGDVLRFKEWGSQSQQYTGRQTSRTISYILINGVWLLSVQVCIMGFEYVLPEEDIN